MTLLLLLASVAALDSILEHVAFLDLLGLCPRH